MMSINWMVVNMMYDIYKRFKIDIMEYLDISDDSELQTIASSYDNHKLTYNDYQNIEEYYKNAGRCYVAHSPLIHNSLSGLAAFESKIFNLLHSKNYKGIDFGCGCAPISFELALNYNHKIYLIDVTPSEQVDFCIWRAKKYNLYNDRLFIGYPENKVDYILAIDSIEHVENWKGTIFSLKNHLNNDGIIITNIKDIKEDIEHIVNYDDFENYIKTLNINKYNDYIYINKE